MKIANLNDAQFVKVYEDSQRVYAWFGGLGVSIYDFEFNEIDYFTTGTDHPSLNTVKFAIEVSEDDLFMDEDYTDDIFVNYEYETGQDLEAQN